MKALAIRNANMRSDFARASRKKISDDLSFSLFAAKVSALRFENQLFADDELDAYQNVCYGFLRIHFLQAGAVHLAAIA